MVDMTSGFCKQATVFHRIALSKTLLHKLKNE